MAALTAAPGGGWLGRNAGGGSVQWIAMERLAGGPSRPPNGATGETPVPRAMGDHPSVWSVSGMPCLACSAVNRLKRVSRRAVSNGVPDAARPRSRDGLMPSAPRPSSLDSFSDHQVASPRSQMTRRTFGMPCSPPPDGALAPPCGGPPGPRPSGGHEQRPGLAAMRLTFVFQRGRVRPEPRLSGRLGRTARCGPSSGR